MNVKFDLNRVCNYMDSFYLDGKEYPIRCKPSVGDYGYFADSPKELETLVIENDFNKIEKLTKIDDNFYRYLKHNNENPFSLYYSTFFYKVDTNLVQGYLTRDGVKQYTKETINAIQFNGSNAKEIREFCGVRFVEYVSYEYLNSLGGYPSFMRPEPYVVLDIPEISQTFNQQTIVHVGDYIIRNNDGTLYPCRKDIFEKNYMEKKR